MAHCKPILLLLLSLLMTGVFHASGQTATESEAPHSPLDYSFKTITNFSPESYDNLPQNWATLQDKRGIIYVANQGGVLEYDGVTWRKIEVPNITVLSMALHEDGTIYVSGIDEIGLLKANAEGSLEYISLVPQLPETQRKLSHVYQVQYTDQGVWFRSSAKLFRWYKGRMTVTERSSPSTGFRAIFSWRSEFYVQVRGTGLTRFNGENFEPVPGGETFNSEKISLAVAYDDRRLLIGTSFNGFHLYDGSKAERFTTEVDGYLKQHRLYHGIALSDGNVALATLSGGLLIMDRKGRLRGMYTGDTGLKDNSVRFIGQDRDGRLWLCLDRGISLIDYSSPLALLDARSDLKGRIFSVTRFKGRLLVGTGNGVYVMEIPKNARPPVFRPLPGISDNCRELLDTGETLLAATHTGIFTISEIGDKGTPRESETVAGLRVRHTGFKQRSYALARSSRFPATVWAGTDNGLALLQEREGRWQVLQQINDLPRIRSIVTDRDGNPWCGSIAQGVVHIEFKDKNPGSDENKGTPEIRSFNTSQGLPQGEIRVVSVRGEVKFISPKGLYRFQSQSASFVPDKLLGETYAGGGLNVFQLQEDVKGHIWFNSDRRIFHANPRSDNTFAIDNTPFLGLPIMHVTCIYPDRRWVWFSTADKLIRFDIVDRKNYQLPFHSLIRSVQLKDEQVIFGGSKPGLGSDGGSNEPLVLEYKDSRIYFSVAAPFFQQQKGAGYQFFLEGHDDRWSAFSASPVKDYTNMNFGSYRFRVRAVNIYGTVSAEDSFAFRILPPWYFTWWAFVLYGLALVALVTQIVKWRSMKLVKEKERLEGIVEARTQEVNRKNEQLQQKTELLEEQSEKLKEMDQIKSRFFANISHEFRTPLTLIIGPLENILSSSKDPVTKDRVGMAHRSARRLLGLINQLLDLSKFESGKMGLQAEEKDMVPFLKNIMEPFELLAQHQQISLQLHSEPDTLPVYFDREKMEKVMANLLSNGLKFTPSGGTVAVSLTVSNTGDAYPHTFGYAEIRVSDSGAGIPADQLPHIFDRFYQAEVTVEYHRKGSGIGLSLVKELVELHRGDITVASRFEDDGAQHSGTEFLIRLPLGSAHLSPADMLDRKPRNADLNGHTPAAPHTEPPAEPPAEPLSEPPAATALPTIPKNDVPGPAIFDALNGQQKPVVLVVEDNADLRIYIRNSLEPEYTVMEAKNGKEGITAAKSIIPDLIVSDIMMPEADGYELCRAIKGEMATSHIPVVLLTAKASEDNIVQGLETGADDYITKPFSTRILQVRIKNLIELRSQLQLKLNRDMVLQPSRMSISDMDKEFLNDLQTVIEKNLSEPDFNVEDLSKRLFMSRTTVYRKIQALSGETPTDFIRSYRLMRAAQLLKSQFGSVTEVAFEVGFSSRAYFTKCFKEKFHQLPSEYHSSES